MARKKYVKPSITITYIDSSISLVMMTLPPNSNGQGWGPGGKPKKGQKNPFESPFSDSPFY
jgi:hypothetical protein